jgi:hypothetical protein
VSAHECNEDRSCNSFGVRVLGWSHRLPLMGLSRVVPVDSSVSERGLAGDSPSPLLVSRRERWYALGALVLLATVLAEALTGSTPVPKLVNPLTFAFVAGNYGACAVLLREATVRWKKGWASALLIGAAFGVESEGLGAKTLIDPRGSVLGTSQLYSYWLGVNWVPFVSLTLFHAIFSMGVPILIVELLAPRAKGKRLLGDSGLALTVVIFTLDSLFLIAVAGPHYFPPLPLLFIAAVGFVYVVAAYLVPRDLLTSIRERPDRPERFYWGIGAGFFAGFFLLSNLGPHLLPAAATVVLFLGLGAFCLWLVRRHAGNSQNEVAKVALVLGLVSVLVPMDVLLEIGGDVGVLVVTALTVILLLYLRRKWLRSLAGETNS